MIEILFGEIIMKELTEALEAKDHELEAKDVALKNKDHELEAKDAEIERLKEQLAALSKNK